MAHGIAGTPHRVSGIFLAHHMSARVARHYERLREESGHLVDWTVALNRGKYPRPVLAVPCEPAETLLPSRYRQMRRHGAVVGGYLDTLLVPCVLAMPMSFVWVMEYDVDFSGNWATFFEQFRDSDADLLTTTITSRKETPGWHHWNSAMAPSKVSASLYHRCFHPLIRMSRRFAFAYKDAAADPAWRGHSEFTFPTAALAQGLSVEDLGGPGAFCPAARQNQNYINNSMTESLQPGTFVWRPAKTFYFHEAPEQFHRANLLYHPIKTDSLEWERTPAWRRVLRPLRVLRR